MSSRWRGRLRAHAAAQHLNRKTQYAVETLNEGGGFRQRHPFHKQSLLKKHPCGVLGDGIVGTCEQFPDDLVIRIDFKGGLGRRNVLLARSICGICKAGSSSLETIQAGLSASRTEVRTAFTRASN